MAEAATRSAAAPLSLRRLWPLAVLALGIAAVFAFDLDRFLTPEALRDHRAVLTDFVAQNRVLAMALFVAVYVAATAMSVPGGTVLTVAGGFLFGIVVGTILVVIGATAGATILFLLARTAFGDFLKAKAGPALARMEEGFRENALSYMLVLRLVPLFPFFLVNLVPAFLGVPLRIFVIGTLIGIIPGTFVFTSVGAGLGEVFDQGEMLTLSGALSPQIIAALVGLALLALVPVVYRRFRARRPAGADGAVKGS